ncbi:MAG: DUF4388 domain-containing protein, partial [Thermoanaerobaculia bacterium]|nr:DUF4388 domain-containing protein [Thermoanaerobaculia bacterium]
LGTIDADDARGWLVALALEPRGGFMALDLLLVLTDSDLSRNPDLIRSLLDTLTALLPVKVLGIALPASVATLKNRQGTVNLVKALAGTRSAKVADRLEEISKQFKGTELETVSLQSVATIRSALSHGPEEPLPRTMTESGVIRPPEATVPTLRRSTSPVVATADAEVVFEGDLEVFRLPDLLQSLSQLGIDGRLLLDDATGTRVSEVGVSNGRVVSATFGALNDEGAIYEILQAPFPGSFRFVRQVNWRGAPNGHDVMGLMMEGMRRIDEFKRMAVLVPDDSKFSLTGSKPSPLTEDDATILRDIWMGAKEGKTARQIEQIVAIDRFRVRSLLAHWVEEGSLTLG